MSPSIELVIFDCDGVLVDSERLAVRVDSALITQLGWALTPQDIAQRFVGHSRQYMREQIEQHLGRRLPDDWQVPFEEAYWALVEAELTAVDGVKDVIEQLTIPYCVASNGSHHKMTRSLRRAGLLHLFTGRLFSADDVTRPKPAPDLHLWAAAQMGAAPEHCVVIEDSPFGLRAARAAGMRTYGFTGGVNSAEQLAGPGTTLFHAMRELPDLLGAEATAKSC
ncbi:HAD family hydrolase [Streptomyces sp. NPDC001852]|uniref:HAD family hydrolase n=1 Tax=Streptomyces sp. NPDC001852 TaxID=3364619 RepID=UPI0036BB8F83